MTAYSFGTQFATIVETTDAPESLPTPYTLLPGDTFLGALNADVDYVRVELTAGRNYTFDLSGTGVNGLADPFLFLLDASGNVITFDDDSGPGLNPSLNFNALTGGTYVLVVDSYPANANAGTGDYQLTVTDTGGVSLPPVGTYDQLADYLTDGYWFDDFAQPHAFDTTTDNIITVNITALTAAGQQLARWAFEAWEMVADLEFVEVGGAADIEFDDNQSGAFASYSAIGNTTVSAFVNISTNWLASYGTTIDSYSFSTYIHEIGHALGLGHQGDYNGSASFPNDATWLNDSLQLSVMSYFSQTQNTYVTASYAEVVTPMLVDVIAIQNLYGAPTGGATQGNTTHGFNTDMGNYLETLFDAVLVADPSVYLGNVFTWTIFDEGGNDTIDLSGFGQDSFVDMGSEGISDVGGLIGNMLIARGTVIENLITAEGNDEILGNGAGNLIMAGLGDDTINSGIGWDTVHGEGGNDSIDALDGYDLLFGGDNNDILNGNNGLDTLHGGAGNDTLTGGLQPDVLNGDAGRDSLYGSAGDDTLDGGAGNDQLFGNAGADELLGFDGHDVLNGGINFDLLDGQLGNDTLNGNNGADTLNGGVGEDILNGNAGADRMDGGADNDILRGGLGADEFVFMLGGGDDIVIDFGIVDTFVVDTNLLTGPNPGLTDYASVAGGDLTLTFLTGDTITFNNITDVAFIEAHTTILL